LAAKFNYSASMIREIKNGNLWKHLENKVWITLQFAPLPVTRYIQITPTVW
jgi:hypothetical protein